jgi:hypothetical protein
MLLDPGPAACALEAFVIGGCGAGPVGSGRDTVCLDDEGWDGPVLSVPVVGALEIMADASKL